MYTKTKGIVLNHFSYSDKSEIVQIYTEIYGKQSFWINGKGTKKGHSKYTLLQPLFFVDIELNYIQKKEIHSIKEFSLHLPFKTIPYQINKSTIAIFLAEFINKSIKEIESNTVLFDYLYHSILAFDELEKGNNFHLLFLLHLTKFLGFFPLNNFSDNNNVFDVIQGMFINRIFSQANCLSEESSRILHELFETTYEKIDQFDITNNERKEILNKLVLFYKHHLEGMGEIKSIKILKDVFI